jgi:hypothetical protein
VSTAFLNGVLEEDVYIELPSIISPVPTYWKLRRALYGLKQAARAWHTKLCEDLTSIGFEQSVADPCVFFKGFGRDLVYLLVHVDDGIIVGVQKNCLNVRDAIASKFIITDAGEATCFLSIEIKRSERGLMLTQEQYCRRILKEFNMDNCTPKSVPMAPGTVLIKDGQPLPPINEYKSIVGSLLYLSTNTRPDIAHAVGVLSRFMSAPTQEHLQAAKYVLRYLAGTVSLGLFYKFLPAGCEPHAGGRFSWWPNDPAELMPDAKPSVTQPQVFADADFGNDKDARKSISGMFIEWQGPITWASKQQSIVTTSTTEAEFVAVAVATKEALWLRKFLSRPLNRAIPVHVMCDNTAAVSLIRNKTAGVSGRTKHIDVQYMFVRERYARGDIDVHNVASGEQLADMFTKPLPASTFQAHRVSIGLISYEAFAGVAMTPERLQCD